MHKTARGMGGCVKNIIMIIIIRITSHDMTIYSPLIKKTAVCIFQCRPFFFHAAKTQQFLIYLSRWAQIPLPLPYNAYVTI